MSTPTSFKNYYYLTKPGIIRGNDLSAIAGFFLGSNKHVMLSKFITMLLGISFVIGGSCVFNNIIDRNIDSKMKRTQKRALVTGKIPLHFATIFGTTLLLTGLALLGLGNNWLSSGIGLFGAFAYVVIYGVAKRGSEFGTIVGSISGAIPPVVGYTAATNRLDITALLLFLVLVFWQMPHFFAIAIFRSQDYKAAGIPVLPIKKGLRQTKIQILIFLLGYIASTTLLWSRGLTSLVYLILVTPISLFWLYFCIKGFKTTNNDKWAKQMFGISLLALLVFSISVALSPWAKGLL